MLNRKVRIQTGHLDMKQLMLYVCLLICVCGGCLDVCWGLVAGCVKLELGVRTLQRLKGLALAGRGISFTHRDQKRESLRDLQLSLQAAPGNYRVKLSLCRLLSSK